MKGPKRISRRQADVWQCIAVGMPDKMVARRLGVSYCTVKVHVTALYRRLGVTNRTQAALRWGQP